MRKELLPSWAQQYKKTGYDVRVKKGQYILFKISSKRVKGKKYPQPIQEYIGIITENDGLIEKKRKISEYQQGETLEYGLSHYIFSRYRRAIQRSLFNTTGEIATSIIILGIIQFIYGHINSDYLSMSYISNSKSNELLELYKQINIQKVKIVSNKIENLLKSVFIDKEDYDMLLILLKQNTIIQIDGKGLVFPSYPKIAIRIFKKYGVEYE